MKLSSLIKGKKVLLLTHHNGDADGVACAIAIAEAYSEDALISIGAPESINRSARNMATALGYTVEINPNADNFDGVVLLDVPSPDQVSPYNFDKLKVIAIIDHHYSRKEFSNKTKNYLLEERPSCCEVIYKLLKEDGKELSEKSAKAMVAGIFADTQHTSLGDVDTFKTLAEIVSKYKLKTKEAVQLLRTSPDVSEKIAVLKAMKNVKLERLGDFLLASSLAGSFEAVVAGTLIRAGADIAVVGAEKSDGCRISGRAAWRMESKIHLGKQVFEPLGKKLGGSGGGHGGAASANLTCEAKKGVEEAAKIIKGIIQA